MLLDPRISPKTALYHLKNAVKPPSMRSCGEQLGLAHDVTLGLVLFDALQDEGGEVHLLDEVGGDELHAVEMLETLVVRGKEHGRGDIRKIGDALHRLAETAEGGLVLPFVDDVAQDLVPAHDLRPDFHQYSATISPK